MKNNLRKTQYFVSKRFNSGGQNSGDLFELALTDVIKKRDSFIIENEKRIDEIIDERLEYVTPTTGSSYIVVASISLTYFLR